MPKNIRVVVIEVLLIVLMLFSWVNIATIESAHDLWHDDESIDRCKINTYCWWRERAEIRYSRYYIAQLICLGFLFTISMLSRADQRRSDHYSLSGHMIKER